MTLGAIWLVNVQAADFTTPSTEPNNQENHALSPHDSYPANSKQEMANLINNSIINNSADDDLNIKFASQEKLGALLNKSLPVFGSNLFGKQCLELKPTKFFNPSYRITVGDQINFQMWGAYSFSQILPVDTQGNIFVPEIGPVHVAGIENGKLNEVIDKQVKKVFSKDVQVYADLVTAQPVQVYVTGYVNNPGLYDGLSSDSVIYFLCKAGGINLKEGSMRAIEIKRAGQELQQVDLYDFMLSGNINQFQLHPGDTIVVKPQAYVISVDGFVNNAYQYEWLTPKISMQSLIKQVNVKPSVTYARIQRNHGTKPEILYRPIADAKKLTLHDGDKVTFVEDHEVNQMVITVKGQVLGKHQFIEKKGQTLGTLVKKLHISPEANLKNLQLFRDSIAKQQKDAINTSLGRLQRSSMVAASTTEAGAKLRASQSEMITKFIHEAKGVKTKGQVVLGSPEDWDKIYLENNDVINIPQKNSVITISGDVVSSISTKVDPNNSIADYIIAAGGLEKSANRKELLLIKQNGEVSIIPNNKWRTRHAKIEGGDQIIVLPEITSENWQITESLSKIFYQVAVAARVALIAI